MTTPNASARAEQRVEPVCVSATTIQAGGVKGHDGFAMIVVK